MGERFRSRRKGCRVPVFFCLSPVAFDIAPASSQKLWAAEQKNKVTSLPLFGNHFRLFIVIRVLGVILVPCRSPCSPRTLFRALSMLFSSELWVARTPSTTGSKK